MLWMVLSTGFVQTPSLQGLGRLNGNEARLFLQAWILMLDIVCNAVFHKTTHYNYFENSRSTLSDFSVNYIPF